MGKVFEVKNVLFTYSCLAVVWWVAGGGVTVQRCPGAGGLLSQFY